MAIELRLASAFSHDERAALWNDAFSDYFAPSHFDAPGLAGFERMCDLDLDGSRVAVEDGRPVAFGMLGVRGHRGWVGGMGVIPPARRRGLGVRMMNALAAGARERGLHVLGLEVLTENTGAIALYTGLEYRTLRTLEVWEGIPTTPSGSAPGSTHAIDLDEAARRIGPAVLEDAPWQRELEPLRRALPDLLGATAEIDGGSATAVYRATPERVSVIAIAAHGSDGPARARAIDALLAPWTNGEASRMVRLLNLPAGDEAGPRLAAIGCGVSHRQLEMALRLA
jgi:GNAT superfamily N-acetyltransferase